MANEYDVVVIGAGTGGYVAAIRAAQLGLQDRRRREAEGARRHLPDLGLHPDQGAARARPRAEDRRRTRRSGASRSARRADRHRHGPGAGAQGQDRQRPDQGHRVPVQEEQDRLDQGHGRLAGQAASVEVTEGDAQTLAAPQGDHRRHRLAAAQRAGHRDRSQADHHERRGDRPEGGAEVDRRSWAAARSASSSRRSSAASAARSRSSSCCRGWCRSRTRRSRPSSRSRSRSRASRCMTGTKVTSAKAGGDGVDIEAQTRRRQDRQARAPSTCSSRPAAGR